MLWILAFHIIFVVAWFAGLFYLPRLFVYHAASIDAISLNRFCLMERKLYFYIMTPAGLGASFFGAWLLLSKYDYYSHQMWMHVKLISVILLWIYHLYCGFLLKKFKEEKNVYTEKFYRWFNEVPTIILFVVVIMAIVKPF